MQAMSKLNKKRKKDAPTRNSTKNLPLPRMHVNHQATVMFVTVAKNI
jgi:hypothetical protein